MYTHISFHCISKRIKRMCIIFSLEIMWSFFFYLKLDWRVDEQQWICYTFNVTRFIFFLSWKTEEFEDQLDFRDGECGNELWPEPTATLWKNYRKQLQSSVSIKGCTDSVWPGVQWLQRSVRLLCFSQIHELTVQRTFPFSRIHELTVQRTFPWLFSFLSDLTLQL